MVKHTQQFFGKLPSNCLSVFGHFVKLALKDIKKLVVIMNTYREIRITIKKYCKNLVDSNKYVIDVSEGPECDLVMRLKKFDKRESLVSQQTNTCSKSTTETLGKGVKYVQS